MVKKLIISENFETARELKSMMSDDMWRQVSVEFKGDVNMLIDGDIVITDDDKEIIRHLAKQPSLKQRFRNAARAASRAYNAVSSGSHVKVTVEVRDKRRNICKECPFNQRKFLGNVCTKCGCNIKAKTTFLTESCPLEKW